MPVSQLLASFLVCMMLHPLRPIKLRGGGSTVMSRRRSDVLTSFLRLFPRSSLTTVPSGPTDSFLDPRLTAGDRVFFIFGPWLGSEPSDVPRCFSSGLASLGHGKWPTLPKQRGASHETLIETGRTSAISGYRLELSALVWANSSVRRAIVS